MKRAYLIIFCCGLGVLTGCAQVASLTRWHQPPEKVAPMALENRWWAVFNDPLMQTLADDLLKQNLDITIARTRVQEARAFTTTATAAFFPEINAKGSASRGNNQIGVTKPASIAQGGFDAAWEIDLFGRTAAQVDAATQRMQGSEARLQDVANSMLAELMRRVVDLRTAQQTLRETKALLDIQDAQIRLIAARAKAGLVDEIALTRAQAERAQTATQLPVAQAAFEGATYQIELLMGKPSGALRSMLEASAGTLVVPPPSQTLALTLEGMRDRPDIRAARADMLAANADLAKSEADLWPRLSLTSFFGAQEGSEGLPIASNPIWSLASGVTAPLLNFGKLRGAVAAADARAEQAVASYEKASLTALAEANTALSDYLNGVNAVSDQETALRHRKETIALATQRYQRGLTDMTDLTTAQTELNQATLLLITRQSTAAQAYIRLQKALGLGVGGPSVSL